MRDLNSIFVDEFKKRFGRSKCYDIYSVPLPESIENVGVYETKSYGVKGIGESGGLYQQFNGKVVYRLPKGVEVNKRKFDLVTRDFALDNNGDYVYEKVSVPSGSMAIVSKLNLTLPWQYKPDEDGFAFVSYNQESKEYLYIMPKIYLYETNPLALVMSSKTTKCYTGIGYKTWDYGLIYLSVIPYKPGKDYVNTRVLFVNEYGFSGFQNIVNNLKSWWIMNGIVPRLDLVMDEESGTSMAEVPLNIGYEESEYATIASKSLGDKEAFDGADVEEY